MKMIGIALAIVAAIAALVFRPPHPVAVVPTAATDVAGTADGPERRRTLHRTPAVARAGVVVYVAGDVLHAGVYRLPAGARAADALARAGGAARDADLVAVNLAAPLQDGDEIAVPKIGAAPVPHARRAHASPRPRAHRGGRRHRRSADDASAGDAGADLSPESVDVNDADADHLAELPDVGPVLASRIVAYRELNGPFATIDELADVDGVTPRILDAIAPYAIVR
jgi:competence protein ComEA